MQLLLDNWRPIVAVLGLLLGGGMFVDWGWLKAKLTPAAGNDDAADFAAVARLQARFERVKCKDGLAAVKTCLEHFFAHEGDTH